MARTREQPRISIISYLTLAYDSGRLKVTAEEGGEGGGSALSGYNENLFMTN